MVIVNAECATVILFATLSVIEGSHCSVELFAFISQLAPLEGRNVRYLHVSLRQHTMLDHMVRF